MKCRISPNGTRPFDCLKLHIRLTRKGKRVAKTVFEQHGRWIAGLLGNLSDAERTQLAILLDKVAGNLGGKTS
jgi:DNA-binding MarR family transcriptional regulator